ncbi:MAG TPA: hypothetical protein VJ912_02880 [Candidatus Nanoarchaeia archaeon]|nr:hypothetical protein [Candidatus Nanoarchaeia archaeon]
MNYTKMLKQYFKKNLKKGYTSESLKWALINQGYSKILVEKALEAANKEMSEKAPIIKEKPRIKYQLYDQNNNPIEVRKVKRKSKFKKWVDRILRD